MDGDLKNIIEQLFSYAKAISTKYKILPYVAFIIKADKIISQGHNMATSDKLLYAGDITQQGDVMAVRNAQSILKTGNLENCTLVSFMEPTILGFDVALWAGIKNFIWCVNKTSIPEQYTGINYRPLDYMKRHPEVRIHNGIKENEALKIIEAARSKNYYPYLT